jgi:hypothetical protein
MHGGKTELEAELEKLQSDDFNTRTTTAKGMQRLRALLPALVAISTPEESAQAILNLLERLSDTPDLDDCELGTPGPMVHELEKLPGYEPQLIESVSRFPTPLTLWMVNRLMNALDKHHERWDQLLAVLKQAEVARNSAPGAREEAKQFVLFQEAR